MTPQLAARIRIPEPIVVREPVAGEHVLGMPAVAPAARFARVVRPELEQDCLPSLWRREALHRRLLGVADMGATALALVVVLNLLGDGRAALAALIGTPLVVVLFKIAGLYDRDELVVQKSTLDEAPPTVSTWHPVRLVIWLSILVDGVLGAGQSRPLALALRVDLGGRHAAPWPAGRCRGARALPGGGRRGQCGTRARASSRAGRAPRRGRSRRSDACGNDASPTRTAADRADDWDVLRTASCDRLDQSRPAPPTRATCSS